MPSAVIVGGFYGDEGKGKIISYLAMKDNPSIMGIIYDLCDVNILYKCYEFTII